MSGFFQFLGEMFADKSRAPAEVPVIEGVDVVGKLSALDEKNGFRDLKFGVHIDGLEGFFEMGLLDDAGRVVYHRPSDSLKIGEADLSSITYLFYRGAFYSVHLNVSSYQEFNRLAEVLLKAYGPPSDYSPGIDDYFWSGGLASIHLSWDARSKDGGAVMTSSPISKQIELDRASDAEKGISDL